MIAATRPVQRPADARLLVVDAQGAIEHAPRARLPRYLRAGDLVVANDAAVLPASLAGVHLASGAAIEVRLAGSSSLAGDAIQRFTAVVFGEGDWRMRTEDRPPPPVMRAGDSLQLGPLRARIERLLGHPRLVSLRFEAGPGRLWAGLAAHGRPIQYSHLGAPLELWDTWTPFAAAPVAFEPPSAGFALDWATITALRARGVQFATLTHAAGISSTGDPVLDARLPLPEPYAIPAATARAIERARAASARVIAVGTTVVRALEHAAGVDGHVRPVQSLADQVMGPGTPLRVVDAIVSGTHERGSSHHLLLEAFTGAATLAEVDAQLEACAYRTHEFGDSVLIERRQANSASKPPNGSKRSLR